MRAFAFTVLASIYLVIAVLIFARRKTGYSHIRHTISELGEIGAADQRLVALGGFLPVGLLLAVVAYFIGPFSPPQLVLALCIATGYLIAALFPCDPHSLGGAIEYAGGAISLVWLSESLGPVFRVAGLAVGIAMVGLSFESGLRGLIQRIAEASLLGGLGLSLWLMRSAV